MFTIKSIARIFYILLISLSLAFSPLKIIPAQAQSAATWYVATTGNNSNFCSDAGSPCLTINAALGKAAAGDTVDVATGTYNTETVVINKSITLSGGWDASFTTQSGLSTIDGGSTLRGIYSTGDPVTVDRFQILHGFSNTSGGGIYGSSGTLTINNSTISNNTAGSSSGGGGIFVFNTGTVILNNSTISNNTITPSGQGSAIDNQGTLTLNNSTVSGNTNGNAVYNEETMYLINSTISNNSHLGFLNYFANSYLQNTIIAGNAGEVDCAGGYGTITSWGHNLIGKGNPWCFYDPTTGDLVGTSQNPINAWLKPLQNNGGPTFTHALLGPSPAINAGSGCLATDQRGVDRSAHTPCDIGAYEVDVPIVSSIQRIDPSPTGASDVHFTVTFSEPMTGVDMAAPFSDFALTNTGVTGAAITAVSGLDATYTVTVNTGSSNGTIRLDLIDDNSIQDGSGNPLGGAGLGDGNFSSGPVYTIINVPTPVGPGGTITDTTPTYTWSKILGATSYQYQLLKGTQVIYTKAVAPGACGPATICSNTPATILISGDYKWKVRAMVDGVWKNYTALKAFKLVDAKPGLWGSTGLKFYVKDTNVYSFSIFIHVYGCGNYKVTHVQSTPIVKKHFAFGGPFYAKGTFGSTTTVTGTLGLLHYYLPNCGYVRGGPFSWTAKWQNPSQLLSIDSEEITALVVEPATEADFFTVEIDPVNP